MGVGIALSVVYTLRRVDHEMPYEPRRLTELKGLLEALPSASGNQVDVERSVGKGKFGRERVARE